ncbi:hypothetical protein OIU74_027891 [Salix koriyanagi]|uniref:Pentatricopeptide repeat-containing protein n=1 Tax=Salix koriyanagi TaxID=2511006 RepID=A0A9Q1A031_9ROSI|nr:hypothetical protein OIU74_027891 [Salix koriyanagi]
MWGWLMNGYRLFESMQRDHGIEARIEHYCCMVNILGQAGWLEEAFELITNMPIPSNDVVWGVLLAACRKYGDVYMGERVVKKLLDLNPDGGYSTVLDDIYAAAGRNRLSEPDAASDDGSTGGGRLAETITERFNLDSKQEAKVFEALEIGEDVVSGTEPGFPNVIIIEGDAKVIDTTIYNSLKAVHRI